MEYYTVNSLGHNSWSIKRYSESIALLDSIIVQKIGNTWSSNDKGFERHKNELASKRIRIVKHFVEQGEPLGTSYWYEGSSINTYKVD